jgi:hypothetical protein
MGKRQRPPPKGRRGLMGLHALPFNQAKKTCSRNAPSSQEA